MLLDISKIKNDDVFDYCVVGTGPAGITLAIELSTTGKRVALLEGGLEQYSDFSQKLYKGNVIGDKYWPLESARTRYFGGTSNHWGGMCRSLDREDFLAKGKYTDTEWPIRKHDIDPFLKRALSILDVKQIPDDIPLDDSGIKNIGFVYSSPIMRFSEKYRKTIIDSENISLVLDANVTSLTTNGPSVSSVKISNHLGENHSVKAIAYILATGGIENSRILLWSNELSNGELVKNKEALWKYWMDHPHFTIGEAIVAEGHGFTRDSAGSSFFSPTQKTMIDNDTLNCGLRLYPVSQEGTKKIITDIACVAPRVGKWAAELFGKNLVCGRTLYAAWEQEPRARNRIELSNELDSLGVPKVNLYWKKSELDLRTVRKTAETFGKYLALKNLGRVRLDDWVLGVGYYPEDEQIGGPHHMGGTRMASNPNKGVVDANCKVFGQSNLYIAGSSVFPSGGHCNPTLPIVQLSLRLADHLIKGS